MCANLASFEMEGFKGRKPAAFDVIVSRFGRCTVGPWDGAHFWRQIWSSFRK